MATDQSNKTPKSLDITAISTKDGASTIECWRLTAPFENLRLPGTSGVTIPRVSLGKVQNASYAIIPPKLDSGLHNAPHLQYVAFISGEAVISLPNSDETATIRGGKDGLILATDTADVSKLGHSTKYPSDQDTISISIPTANGAVPPHTLLHRGPCRR